MRVLLSTYGGRGDVEPLVGLAVRFQALGAEVGMCAPPDWAERLAEVGVPLTPVGEPVRPLMHGVTPPSPADVPRRAAELIAAQFDELGPAAEGCDALVATGLLPAVAGARSVSEKLGIPYIYAAYCPIFLPSPHYRPTPFPGRPLPPDVTANRLLWGLTFQSANDLFGAALNARRASIGLGEIGPAAGEEGPATMRADRLDGHPGDVLRGGPRPQRPCQPRSGQLCPPSLGPGRVPWPARSAPTGRRWARSCCSTQSAERSAGA